MSWKTFKFFELDEAKDPETQEPFSRLKDLSITCCSCGRGMMVFGDGEGFIHILSSFSSMYSFQAFVKRVQHTYQLKSKNIIVTVGDDEDFQPLIRVFNLDKRDKQGTPHCYQTMKATVFSKGVEINTSSVMCVCAHENCNLIAMGFKSGTIVVLKGDITRGKAPRQMIVHQRDESTEAIYVTGLAFRQVGHTPVLMGSTNNAVYSFFLGDKQTTIQVGNIGCELNCSTLSDHTEDYKYVIGRPEAVHFFTAEGPAQCKVFEGDKSLVRWYRGYLIVVCEPNKGGSGRGLSGSRSLAIYDIQNQFIAYQGRFDDLVTEILCEWGSLFVLLKSGRLIKLDELDTKTKLETLFKKNLYHTAISLARSQSYSDGLVEIFTQYGDHLYSKGDFDGAIAQFKLTIGTLEPSYVIRKFLDAQRIHNLTDYLKELHDKEMANSDHTTLLLNCYTKLKNVDQLNMFVKEDRLSFDVEAAIKVCRQSLYYEQALALAQKNNEHDWYLLIVLGDLSRHSDALDYIKSLDFKSAEIYMVKYGRSIFQALPDDTTNSLVTLCTDWPVGKAQPTPTTAGSISGPSETKLRSSPGKFISVFVDNKNYLMEFLEKMLQLRDCWEQKDVCNTLLELYLTENIRMDKEHRQSRALNLMQNPNAKYDIDHALMLARTCDFKNGILYLYEKAELYQQILAYHMEHDDTILVIETCKRFSMREPTLWVQALTYFASREFCREKISEVLQYIDQFHLLQPLMVVQLLAQYKYATLGDIEPYLLKHLEAQNDTINKDEKQIKDYRESTLQLREQISVIQGKAKVFQVMKCSGCQRSLTLPAVHFLCHHSFHQGMCLDDENENQCPVCARENRKFLDIIHMHEKTADLDEKFHSQLTRSSDGFSVVAEYFGRGVFAKVKKQGK